METKYSHETNFGLRNTPYADHAGFVKYRDGYERLPESKWTAAEKWIAAQCARIDAWREQSR